MNIVRRTLLIASVTASVAGCASATRDLPEELYYPTGEMLVMGEKCAIAGHMTPEAAALAKAVAQHNLRRHTYDSSRMAFVIENSEYLIVNRDFCTKLAIQIATEKMKIENQARVAIQSDADVLRVINSNRVKNTYCNKIGPQILCTTH